MAETQTRRNCKLNPDLIIKEIEAFSEKKPLVIIDEIQKVPKILDPIQSLIDNHKATFILTGSSARKLRRQSEVNLLPGRVVSLHMDPFTNSEFSQDLENHLIYGSLPGIATKKLAKNKNIDLRSYVDTYLEEEIRAEAIVRNLPAFYRFLEVAALESGKIVSFNAISQSIGVAHTTISSYFEILEDCIMAERVDPIFESASRKKLTSREGTRLGSARLGELFENFVGLELIRESRLKISTQICFWRDPDGPEVDWVVKTGGIYIPLEVKMKPHPTASDAKHIETFLREYSCPLGGYIICTDPRRFKVSKDIIAMPWQEIPEILLKAE